MHGTGGQIIKNIRVMLIGQLITWAITFIGIIYVPRYLGATDWGRLAIALAIWSVMSSIINTGTATYLTKEVAKAPARAEELLGTVLIQRLIIFLISCLFVGAYVHFMQYSKETVALVWIVALTMPATQSTLTLNAIFQGREVMQYLPLIEIFSKGTWLIMSLACLYIGLGVNAIAAISIISLSLAAAIQFAILRRYMPIRLTWNTALSFDLLRMGWPYCISSLVLIIYGEIDKLIMPLLVNEREVGWYSIAATLAMTLIFIPNILSTAIFPALTRGTAEGGAETATRILRKSFDVALITGIPIGLGLAIVAQPLVDLIYRSAFPESGPVLSVMSIMLIFTYISTVLGRFLVATGRTNAWTLAMIACILLAFPLNFVLIPWSEQTFANGAIGGAMRLFLTEFLMMIFSLWMLPRGTLTRESASTALRTFVAGGVMFAACWYVKDMFIGIVIAVGIVTYALMILALRVLKPEDVDLAFNATRGALSVLRFRRGKPPNQ